MRTSKFLSSLGLTVTCCALFVDRCDRFASASYGPCITAPSKFFRHEFQRYTNLFERRTSTPVAGTDGRGSKSDERALASEDEAFFAVAMSMSFGKVHHRNSDGKSAHEENDNGTSLLTTSPIATSTASNIITTTEEPSAVPTVAPSISSSNVPTATATATPTAQFSASPSTAATVEPTITESETPSAFASHRPSDLPSQFPSAVATTSTTVAVPGDGNSTIDSSSSFAFSNVSVPIASSSNAPPASSPPPTAVVNSGLKESRSQAAAAETFSTAPLYLSVGVAVFASGIVSLLLMRRRNGGFPTVVGGLLPNEGASDSSFESA